jgi:hypothetical protein
MKKPAIVCQRAVVPNHQTSEVARPGKRAFDDPRLTRENGWDIVSLIRS